MNSHIVHDGLARLAKGRYDRDVAASQKKHAAEWPQTGWFKRVWLYLKIRRQAATPNLKDHQPSAGSLW